MPGAGTRQRCRYGIGRQTVLGRLPDYPLRGADRESPRVPLSPPQTPGFWLTEPTTVVAPAPKSGVLGSAWVVKIHNAAELTHKPGVFPLLFGASLSGEALASVTWNQ